MPKRLFAKKACVRLQTYRADVLNGHCLSVLIGKMEHGAEIGQEFVSFKA